ncbi:MAG: hypothetical protein H0X51_02150 [Parachlamydiaceae bacterium]|nr:hypothetical protein [Parachlamydiaceae bacterium]
MSNGSVVANEAQTKSYEHEQMTLNRELEDCLRNVHGIDQHTTDVILSEFREKMQDAESQLILKQFLTKSKGLSLNGKTATTQSLPAEDAILQAPDSHEVLFENGAVRLLWGVSKPGDQEPSHLHQWPSLMLITQGGKFAIDYVDGTKEEDFWPKGVYELPSDSQPAAYTNTGTTEFRAFRFEIKP